jgi:uncharacterized membrane protein
LTGKQQHNATRFAGLGYLLLFLGCIFGITALIGAIINHTHWHKVRGTAAQPHIIAQLIAFWTIAALAGLTLLFIDSAVAVWFAIAGCCLWITTLLFGTIALLRQRTVQ